MKGAPIIDAPEHSRLSSSLFQGAASFAMLGLSIILRGMIGPKDLVTFAGVSALFWLATAIRARRLFGYPQADFCGQGCTYLVLALYQHLRPEMMFIGYELLGWACFLALLGAAIRRVERQAEAYQREVSR